MVFLRKKHWRQNNRYKEHIVYLYCQFLSFHFIIPCVECFNGLSILTELHTFFLGISEHTNHNFIFFCHKLKPKYHCFCTKKLVIHWGLMVFLRKKHWRQNNRYKEHIVYLYCQFLSFHFIIPCVECFNGLSILTELHTFFKILHHKVRCNKQ